MKTKTFGNINRVKCFLILILFLHFAIPDALAQQEQLFTIEFKDSPLTEVFDYIGKHSHFIFTYNSSILRNDTTRISHHFSKATIEEVMNAVLSKSPFTYERIGTHLIIKPKQQNQTRYIQGNVTDQAGIPLPGVTIRVSGTTIGISTDANGNYTLSIPDIENPKLIFSFIGMKQQEILVGKQSIINIKMEADIVELEDVVIQGAYGTVQKREDMVSSAFQINSDDLKYLPPTRLDNMLEGMIPGLIVEPFTDSPDNTRARYNVRVRGEKSMDALKDPLWIVDGVPFYTGDKNNAITGTQWSISPLSFFNPEDIESITVLKDATATSIYGADGANGVILITTKKGLPDRKSFNVSLNYGLSHINKSTQYKMLNASDYLMLAKEAYANAGKDPALFPWQDNELNTYSQTDTDWTKVFYGTGRNMNFNLSYRGGSEKSTYYISGAYYRYLPTIKGNTQERISLRINNEIKFTERLKGTFLVSLSYNINNLFNPGKNYYEYLPIFSPYNQDGYSIRQWNQYVDGTDAQGELVWRTRRFFNSVAEREENDNKQRTVVVDPNILIRYNILEGLSATAQVGIDFQNSHETIYSARSNWSGINLSTGEARGYSTRTLTNHLKWMGILRANYNKTFGLHTIGGLAGYELSSKEYNNTTATGNGFVNDHIKEISYAAERKGSSSSSTTRTMSFFLQGNYNWDQRYFFLFNMRRDGNSGFGKDVRWANFASAGISWNVHNEPFFRSDVFNVVKLKASYGSNGTSRLGSYEAQGTYSYSDSDQYIGAPGGSLSSSPNPNLSWETTYMTNLGIRLNILDRLDIELEWYNNRTEDLLSNLDVSWSSGERRITRNMGTIRNRGIELTIDSKNIDREFKWETNFNLSHNKNKILKLSNEASKVMGNYLWREGYDIKTLYLIRWAGVDPRDGMPLWYDSEGNITREYNTNNRVACGTSSVKFSGGITNQFSYKNLHLRVMMSYMIGGKAFSSFSRGVNSDGLNIMDANQSIDQLDRWQKPGDIASVPKLIWGTSTRSTMNSTRFLYKCTHLKLQNISLTYNLSNDLLKSVGINKCSFTFIADNLGIWTPYDKKNRNSYKTSMFGYPMESTYSLNLGITF